jgi:hypothetical protein
VSTVSSLANFFAEKTMAGLGDWKVQLDPRGLMDINPHTRVIDLVAPKIDGYDEHRNVLFLAAMPR